jgi:putative oxidoreductase
VRRQADIGLVILRFGIGSMFFLHGAPKLLAGPERWSELGAAMSSIGVTGGSAFWGFMASFSEFFGAICLVLGLFSRVASFLLLFTMVVAASWHLTRGDGLMGSSHAIELAIVFLCLLIAGPGSFSLDHRWNPFQRVVRRLKRHA